MNGFGWIPIFVSVEGFVIGYLMFPAMILVPTLADWILRRRPEASKSAFVWWFTVVAVAYGIVIVLFGATLGWTDLLSRNVPPEIRQKLGSYWGRMLFIGMLTYAWLPAVAGFVGKIMRRDSERSAR
jgi:cytochrome c biogenesis protein CcdA